jgi:hypothetical protein
MLNLIAQSRPDDLPPWLLVGGAAFAVVLVVILLMPLLRRRHDPLSRPPLTSLAQERSVQRDMQSLIHELSEMSRRVGTQLDARAARLERLIQDADERLARLGSAQRASGDQQHGSSGHHGNGDSISESLHRDVPAIDPRHEQVYALQDQGLSPHQIADRLNRPEGEVELIVALRPSRRTA